MSFKLLKTLIAHLKKTFKCQSCNGTLNDESIFVLATSPSVNGGAYHGLILIECPKCQAQSFVFAESKSLDPKLLKDNIRLETKIPEGPISTNEVLDMHNFLKSWKGDVKELF